MAYGSHGDPQFSRFLHGLEKSCMWLQIERNKENYDIEKYRVSDTVDKGSILFSEVLSGCSYFQPFLREKIIISKSFTMKYYQSISKLNIKIA